MQLSPKAAVVAVVITCVLLFFSSVTALHFASTYAGAAMELKQAEKAADVASRAAEAALDLADSVSAVADSQARRADSLKTRGEALELRVASLRGQFKQAAATAPDTCAQVVFLAQITIDSLAEDASIQHRRADSADSAYSLNRFVLDTTQAALRQSRAALLALGRAALNVEKASRPSLLSRVLPHAGFGGAAGIDPFGRPNAVIGVTFGWSF